VTHHLVGLAEIAEILGVSKQRVSQLVSSYDDFPLPESELASGRIWSRTAVETWIATHQERRPGRPEGSGRRRARRPTFQRFTDKARRVISKAQEEARFLKHDYIGTEHLLLGLLAVGTGLAYEALTKLELTPDDCRQHIVEITGLGEVAPAGHIAFTARSKKVLELALREAMQLGHNYIGTEHILLAIVREGEGVAAQILAIEELDLHAVRQVVLDTMRSAAQSRPLDNLSARLDEIVARIEKIEKKEDG
jgi:hypothetical protein